MMKQLFSTLLVAAVLSSCSTGKSGDKKAELAQLKKEDAALRERILKLESEVNVNDTAAESIRDVAFTKLNPVPFSHLIEVQARVDADENVNVSSETMGNVIRINVKAGDHIRRGGVIAELDNAVYSKGLDELQSQRDFANTIFQKQQALWNQKIGTEVQFLQAKNNLEAIDRKISTVRQQVDQTRIKSPIDGTVDDVMIKLGQAVTPGIPVARVVNFSRLKIKAEVAEAYISKIKSGDPVQVYLPDVKKTIDTKITYSGKAIDALNRTFNVEVNMPHDEKNLHPNMVAVLRIADYHNPKAILLPMGVVQTTPEGSYVFVSEVANGKTVAKKRMVTTGHDYNGVIEITEGLKPGDNVITTGYQDLSNGQTVKF